MEQYQTEANMADIVRKELNFYFGGDTEITSEFRYGSGRTDLVFSRTSEKYLAKRAKALGKLIPIEKRDYLRMFLQIRDRKRISEDKFYEVGARQPRYKKKALSWLLENNFVMNKGNKIKTAPDLRRHITESHAVELKIKDWRTALEQAYGGRAYTNAQYVALAEENIDPVLENLDEFKRYNIGVVAVRKNVGCEVIHDPEKSSPFSPIHTWRLNERTLKVMDPN